MMLVLRVNKIRSRKIRQGRLSSDFCHAMTQPINAAAMGGCHITVLRTAGPYQVATKHWRWNPIRNAWTKISDFSAGGWFTAEVRPVASLDDLSTTLDVIRRDPRAFIVRGELTEQARTAIASDPQQRIRRRKIARDGILPSLQEVALRWIMIDIDGWELPEWGT